MSFTAEIPYLDLGFDLRLDIGLISRRLCIILGLGLVVNRMCLFNIKTSKNIKVPKCKGSFQKRFSGIRPLRGYPPPPRLNGKSV